MKSVKYLTRVALAASLVSQGLAAEDAGSRDAWEFRLTPYVWLPTIAGKLNYDLPGDGGGGTGDGAPRIDVGPTDWLDLLNGVFLLQGEVRRNRFLAFTDVVYLGLESDDDRVLSVSTGIRDAVPVDSTLNLKTRTDIDGFTMTLAGGFNVLETERATLDVFAGARFFGLETTSSWELSADISSPIGGSVLEREGAIEDEVDSWDGIVGIKGRRRLGNSNWSLPYYLDVGTGDSDLTWQVIAGASYAFGWGDLIISYRHFEYDGGPTGLMEEFSFSGPVIGGRFSF